MGEFAVPLALAVVATALLLLAVLAVVRRLVVSRSLGAFDCSRRCSGGSWSLGVARYGSDRLDWFPVFSLSPRPRASWRRCELTVQGSRPAHPAEAAAVLPEAVVVCCRVGAEDLDLAMAPDAYTGLTSWLEAAPPTGGGIVT